jgi:hypothetical protein
VCQIDALCYGLWCWKEANYQLGAMKLRQPNDQPNFAQTHNHHACAVSVLPMIETKAAGHGASKQTISPNIDLFAPDRKHKPNRELHIEATAVVLHNWIDTATQARPARCVARATPTASATNCSRAPLVRYPLLPPVSEKQTPRTVYLESRLARAQQWLPSIFSEEEAVRRLRMLKTTITHSRSIIPTSISRGHHELPTCPTDFPYGQSTLVASCGVAASHQGSSRQPLSALPRASPPSPATAGASPCKARPVWRRWRISSADIGSWRRCLPRSF